MPQFLALARRNVERFSDAEFGPLLEPEAERARELYAAGTFRQMWSRGDVPGAAIIVEAASADEARAALASLPLVERDMLGVELIALAPYRGFGPRG